MSLKNEVEQEQKLHANRMSHILSSLSDEESGELIEMILDERYNAASIAKVLRKRGYKITDRTVQRYRVKLMEEN